MVELRNILQLCSYSLVCFFCCYYFPFQISFFSREALRDRDIYCQSSPDLNLLQRDRQWPRGNDQQRGTFHQQSLALMPLRTLMVFDEGCGFITVYQGRQSFLSWPGLCVHNTSACKNHCSHLGFTGTVGLHAFPPFLLTTVICGGYYYYFHFTVRN